ncbi:MAG: hypothetical protein E2P08_01155 [Acidobacteria bacterium]|nr:MAG: hypothetical protein E2P08_01155 [Acidobacteriota bacterium]
MILKLSQYILLTLTLTVLLDSPNVLWGQTSASQPVTSSGKEFVAPQKEVNGILIGQEDVLIQEVVVTDSGRQYRRLDVGVSGTLEGWALKEVLPMPQFVSAPEFVFIQGGNVGPRFHGTLRYEASKGTGMTIIYPESGTVWNKKLFVTVHGSSGSFFEGTLKPWNRIFDPLQPLGDISKYERLMLDKGYAIAKTRRNASSKGDYSVTLDDGEILEGWNLNTHTDLILDFARLAENLLKNRLGESPLRTYLYGHSAGAMIGRLINYVPGLNEDDATGTKYIDGFLHDDSGGGRYLPILEENGRDVLFTNQQERQRFVKTIEITHQLYIRRRNTNSRRNIPSWVSPVYLMNKRMNAKILRDKGLGDRSRMYEVRGISHMGGEYLEDGRDGDVTILDLSPIIDALIDVLDHWVEQDITPPPSKSDWLELGDVDADGVIENEAIALPDVACPLGLYYPYPPSRGESGVGWTGFAAFDGQSLEPLDGRGVFVDMNLNRYLDHRESLDQAWHRLGLLTPGEKFSRRKYQACVEAAVGQLKQEKLITDRGAARYIQKASEADLPGH